MSNTLYIYIYTYREREREIDRCICNRQPASASGTPGASPRGSSRTPLSVTFSLKLIIVYYVFV